MRSTAKKARKYLKQLNNANNFDSLDVNTARGIDWSKISDAFFGFQSTNEEVFTI